MDIHSKASTQAFRDNFDVIFGKKEDKKQSDFPETVNVPASNTNTEQTIHKV